MKYKLSILLNFLDNNNLKKEANFLKKISTPLDAEYLPSEDRSEVLERTKKITPKVYISKNIYNNFSIENEMIEYAKKNNLSKDSVLYDSKTFIEDFEYILSDYEADKKYEDSTGTITMALSKDEIFKILNESDNLYKNEHKNFAFKKTKEKIISMIESFPSGYDLYFIPLIYVGSSEQFDEFVHMKEFVYHDFIGHAFESAVPSFTKLIDDYIRNILSKVFMFRASNLKRADLIKTFVEVIGQDNFNKMFGQEIASGIYKQDDTIVDSYYDLFSILLKDNIKINKLNIIGIKSATESNQKIFDILTYDLEDKLNSIKGKLVNDINEELNSIGDKKYLIQFIE